MECNDIQQQLCEWIDGTLDEPLAITLREHLTACEICRSEEQQLADVHSELTTIFAVERDRAGEIAERVLQEFSASPTRAGSQELARRDFHHRWLSGTAVGYLLSAVAGFLMATVWFQSPQPSREDIAITPLADDPLVVNVSPAAQLVHATGNVSYRPPTEDAWTSISPDDMSMFACPAEGGVRTEAGVLCELETSTGSLVRLNESSEVTLLSDDHLELVRGQVWCRASRNRTLKVITASGGHPDRLPSEQWVLTCPTNTESLTSCKPSEPLKVVATAGTVDVQLNGTEHHLPPGTICSVSDGEVKLWQSSHEMLTAERWMQPLLTLSGHGNPELTRRVDALLARIGRSKLSYLDEQDLRSLGEYGAVPLLKFMTAKESANAPSRRRLAMKILADTAPVWMVPDLIGLLEDNDPEVRHHTAHGLARLTGETQGLSPEDWKADRETWATGLNQWQTWWQQNRFRCAAPPDSI